MKEETYQRVKDWCDAYKISMSSFVEERVADFFGGVKRTPSHDDTYPGSDQRKEKPLPAKKPTPTGGGYHEF